MKKAMAGKISPRLAAIEILCRWEESGEPVDQMRDQWLAEFPVGDPRDLPLVNAMLFGVLRQRGILDWIISTLAHKTKSKLAPRVANALRVGLFQLLFLDRIPDSAAINETINALKTAGEPKWITGFVNGILRNAARQRADLPDFNGPSKAIADHVRLSHPKWLFGRWVERYGLEKARAICQANNQQAALCLRVDSDRDEFLGKLADNSITAEAGTFSANGVLLPDFRGNVTTILGFAAGRFQVQDEAAQLVTMLFAPFAPGNYLDGCAGLGGKTSHLAHLLPPASQIVALDPSEKRLELWAANIKRLGLTDRIETRTGTVQELGGQQESFAGILIDAPCSGLGVIRRHPDIRWNRQPADLARNQSRQLEIIHAAADLLAPGGILVYATCSTEPEENDLVVDNFLKKHPDFTLTPAQDFLPPYCAILVDEQGFFRTLPGEHGLDGFFAARLKKK